MLHFTANKDQANALEGLAYWIANIEYIKSRYGADDPEVVGVDATIKMTFDELDALGVPFWVQNTVIAFASDYKQYLKCYLRDVMREKNIIM